MRRRPAAKYDENGERFANSSNSSFRLFTDEFEIIL